MSIDSVMKSIRDNNVHYIDLRFTDILGKEMHFTVPVECFDEDSFEFGHPFDGSSIAGWRGIESSDMILRPDPHSFRLDPFAKEKTAVFVCDEKADFKSYATDNIIIDDKIYKNFCCQK